MQKISFHPMESMDCRDGDRQKFVVTRIDIGKAHVQISSHAVTTAIEIYTDRDREDQAEALAREMIRAATEYLSTRVRESSHA